MRGGHLIHEARLRAGLTQAVLAKRLRTSQAAVARWEALRASPSLETVQEAIRACGFSFQVRMPPLDLHDIGLALERARLPRSRRFEEFLESIEFAEDLREAGLRARRRRQR